MSRNFLILLHMNNGGASMIRSSRYWVGVSSSRSFRRCMRKWYHQSGYGLALDRKENSANMPIPFWLGSGLHYALEDFHGYNLFRDPRLAAIAYYKAHLQQEMPAGADDAITLVIDMLEYYLEWLPKHNDLPQFQTLWQEPDGKYVIADNKSEKAVPLCEKEMMLDMGVRIVVESTTGKILGKFENVDGIWTKDGFSIEKEAINIDDSETIYELRASHYLDSAVNVQIMPIVFHGTCDKVVIDKNGSVYLVDYKTAKGADIAKLATDDQISRYIWAMEQILNLPIKGFIYLQFTKERIKEPKVLKNGDLSTDKKQKTTSVKYKQAIEEIYGGTALAPSKVIDTLNAFRDLEHAEGDRFIRWDIVERDLNQKFTTYNNIMGEIDLMTNPNLYPIPNPTRDCSWDCPFREACILYEKQDMDGYNDILESEWQTRTKERGEEDPTWQSRIPKVLDVITEELEDFDSIDDYIKYFRETLCDFELDIENIDLAGYLEE